MASTKRHVTFGCEPNRTCLRTDLVRASSTPAKSYAKARAVREGMNVHAVRAVRVRRRSGTARHSLNARVNAGKRKFPQTVTYTRLRNVQPAAAPPPRGSLISCLRLLYGGLGEPRTRRARVLGSPRPSGRHRAGYSHCSCRLARPGALTYRRDITRVS